MGSFASGPIAVLTWAMYADVADYFEWKHNRSATGLVFAAATLSQKIGGAIGGAIPAWCLFFFGFVQPADGVRQLQSGVFNVVSRWDAVLSTEQKISATSAGRLENTKAKRWQRVTAELR